jgi:hypothetical protein
VLTVVHEIGKLRPAGADLRRFLMRVLPNPMGSTAFATLASSPTAAAPLFEIDFDFRFLN